MARPCSRLAQVVLPLEFLWSRIRSAWPETIVFGRVRAAFEDGRMTAPPKAEIARRLQIGRTSVRRILEETTPRSRAAPEKAAQGSILERFVLGVL
jgi:hypothetical protein